LERSKLDRITPGRPQGAKPAAEQVTESDAVDPTTAGRKAVALSYAPDTADSAPTVSASGQGHLAERILEVARESGVPIHKDADLLELLAASQVGDEIPVEAFIAVAEILRYVYQANGESAPLPGRKKS
jgi:flagellar biosynthesis protein